MTGLLLEVSDGDREGPGMCRVVAVEPLSKRGLHKLLPRLPFQLGVAGILKQSLHGRVKLDAVQLGRRLANVRTNQAPDIDVLALAYPPLHVHDAAFQPAQARIQILVVQIVPGAPDLL